MFSFQGASESLQSRDSMKFLVSKELQSISLVEISGIEPLTSCLQGRRSPSWAKPPGWIWDMRYEIWDTILFLRYKFISYLISYIFKKLVGQNGLEPSTSRLSVVCSSQLSYWPILVTSSCLATSSSVPSKLNNVNPFLTLCTDLRTLQVKSSSYLKSP